MFSSLLLAWKPAGVRLFTKLKNNAQNGRKQAEESNVISTRSINGNHPWNHLGVLPFRSVVPQFPHVLGGQGMARILQGFRQPIQTLIIRPCRFGYRHGFHNQIQSIWVALFLSEWEWPWQRSCCGAVQCVS